MTVTMMYIDITLDMLICSFGKAIRGEMVVFVHV